MNHFEFLNQFHELSQEDYKLLSDKFKLRNFNQGEIIVSPGQIQTELYFVKTGIQMSYFESEKRDNVIAFTYAPNLCAIPGSFSLQVPSEYYLRCLSESSMDCISFDNLQELMNQSQQIERLFRRMTEFILAGLISRHIELHSLRIEERFIAFCKRSPYLLNKIPHKYIASYLSIEPTNFSKLFNNVKI